jgi:predicted metal-binding transcription factor (methanogenesis marker protein 9)
MFDDEPLSDAAYVELAKKIAEKLAEKARRKKEDNEIEKARPAGRMI